MPQMALHNDGEFVAVVVDPAVRRPCALVASAPRTDYATKCRATDAKEAGPGDEGQLAVGWLVDRQACFVDPLPQPVLADAQVTGTFVHRMAEPEGWKYGDPVWWCGGLSAERGGVFVGWLLECKFGYARVQIDVTGMAGGI